MSLLKDLWKQIQPFRSQTRFGSSARKKQWVDAITEALRDPELVRGLQGKLGPIPQTQPLTVPLPVPPVPPAPPAAPAYPTYVFPKRKKRPNSVLELENNVSPENNLVSFANTFPGFKPPAPPMYNPYSPLFGDSMVGFSGGLPTPMPQQKKPRLFPPATTIQATSSNKTKSAPRVKLEPNSGHPVAKPFAPTDDEPQTPQEWSVVRQLQAMGFSDMREMLAGTRRVLPQPNPVEAAMMWIIQQREESEESRKMDAARARSEQLRQEQQRIRQQQAKERLESTTLEQWSTERDLFYGSLILKNAMEQMRRLRKANAQVLVTLLQLEKKARKWYGTALPYCYWIQLAKRLNNAPTVELVERGRKETALLQTSMFSLEQQQGGVPRIFVEARDAAKKQGLPVSPNKTDGISEDSGEIMVVEHNPSPHATKTRRPQEEVIEIL